MDVIDKFYKKNTNLDYPFDIIFLHNGKMLDMSLTVSQYFHGNTMRVTGIPYRQSYLKF